MGYRNYIVYLFSLLSFSVSAQKETVKIDSLLAKGGRLQELHTDSALTYSFKAAEISQQIMDTIRLVKSYKQIAEAYNKMDDADLTIFYAQQAMNAATYISDETLKAHVTARLGKAFFRKGYYDQAIGYYRKAKLASDKLADDDLRFFVYNLLGFYYIVSNSFNTDSAEYYYNVSMKVAEKQKDSLKLAQSYINIANVYVRKEKWDEDLAFLLKALDIYTKKKDLDGMELANKSIGDVYYYTKKNEKAIEYYAKAYTLAHEMKSTTSIAYAACDLAYMYALNKKINLLDKYAAEAKQASAQTKSWVAIKYVGGWLSEAYEMTGNIQTSYEFYKMYANAKDSINNRERLEKSVRAEAQIDFEKKVAQMKTDEEKRRAISEEKEHHQKMIQNILIAGFIIALILLFIAYRSYVAKKRANVIISKQKEEVQLQKLKIEEINKEVTDSINYARLIQRSILPSAEDILKVFPKSFGLYKPKSVVSGDFYWFAAKNGYGMMAAVDCTGHGVPGALMSMIGVEKLNEAIASNLTDPSDILSHLNKGVKTTLRQNESGSTSRDGMDIALCCFELPAGTEESPDVKLKYAGANRALWLIREGKLTEYKPTKSAIGGYTELEQKFATHEIQLQKGDSIYLSTDGFADQFGGDKGKKMMTKNMKDLLLSIQHIPFLEQEKFLDEKLKQWQGNFEQVDDILVIGIQI